MAHSFYGEPTTHFKLVGVTGTNGKTTIATLIFKLFTSLGYKCGLVSTVQYQVGETVFPSTHTTPDAISLNRLLKQMQEAGCSYVFMECSSHAIEQQRIAGLQFAGALFSNITHDHLDYHKTFDDYIRVKKSWFDGMPKNAFAISNADDKRGAVMLQNTDAKKYFYSLKTMAAFKGKILDNSLAGLHMTVNDVEVHFKLIGEFNAYNLQGRDLVYLQEVDFDVSNPDLGLFVPWFKVPADAVLKVGVGAFAGTKVASALEAKKHVPEVFITYSKKEGEISLVNVGHNFTRPVWEGMPELVTKRWYILAKDEKGKYLIPCDASCQPER